MEAIGLKDEAFDLRDGYMSKDSPNFDRLTDNYSAYALTYRPCLPRPYNLQFDFLKRMLTSAKQRNVQVILVNMPLRQDNLKAMMPGFYDLYRKDLQTTARQYGAHYVDMFDAQRYKFEDFTDTVHLTSRACGKFITDFTAKVSPVVLASTRDCRQTAYREKMHTF